MDNKKIIVLDMLSSFQNHYLNAFPYSAQLDPALWNYFIIKEH